jgi:hypothetical protein
MKKIFFLALAGVAASAAVAQTQAPRDPSDSRAQVPPVQYRSAFEGYRSYSEPPAIQWRDANDEVRAFGGHAGHLVKPGSADASKPATGSAPARDPKPGNREGHHR